jgi:hypothetical protein
MHKFNSPCKAMTIEDAGDEPRPTLVEDTKSSELFLSHHAWSSFLKKIMWQEPTSVPVDSEHSGDKAEVGWLSTAFNQPSNPWISMDSSRIFPPGLLVFARWQRTCQLSQALRRPGQPLEPTTTL